MSGNFKIEAKSQENWAFYGKIQGNSDIFCVISIKVNENCTFTALEISGILSQFAIYNVWNGIQLCKMCHILWWKKKINKWSNLKWQKKIT